MVEIIKYGNFEPIGFNKKKTQIILCHTSRDVEEYLTSLKFRYFGKYTRIPHYVITKTGKTLQLLPDESFSSIFSDELTNKNGIIIYLENLGWLEKKPLSNEYISWNGGIYNGKPYEKKWRDYFFWDNYTEPQLTKLTQLCLELCNNFNIEKKFIGINTKQEGIKHFDGIVCRSNFNTRFTDLNPSFDFVNFLNNIENESTL